MTGLLHLTSLSGSRLSRRVLVAGAAGAATSLLAGPGMARQATPGATPAVDMPTGPARARLDTMLSLLPPGFLDVPDPNIPLFTWVDLASHLAAFGSPDLFSGDVAIVPILGALYIDAPLVERAMDEQALELFGFSVLEAEQVLSAGSPPDRITFYAFPQSVRDLAETWEASGYERVDGEAGEFWTIGEEGDLDLSSDIGRIALANMNNLAIVDDRVVVAARTSALLGQVLAMLESGGESAADQAGLQAMLETLPEDAVNVVALLGEGLEAHGLVPENPGREGEAMLESLLAESDDAVGPMPPVDTALFGITAGMAQGDDGNDDAVFFGHLAMASPEDATQAAAVVAWRMANMVSPTTGAPFGEHFQPAYDPADAVSGDVAVTAFTGPGGFVPWQQMVLSLDLWPFVWLGEA